jgi:hypothetical protein
MCNWFLRERRTRANEEQEGYLAKHGGGDEERFGDMQDAPADPMQGLEGLDVAGPKPA